MKHYSFIKKISKLQSVHYINVSTVCIGSTGHTLETTDIEVSTMLNAASPKNYSGGI
jgi:hypothetical protein